MQTLAGLSILVLEDEFLIALDVEECCREHGARDVSVCSRLAETQSALERGFDAAVVDMRLAGESTLDFAETLFSSGRPFIFATGHFDSGEIQERFPGVEVVIKPYGGDDLVSALARAIASVRGRARTDD